MKQVIHVTDDAEVLTLHDVKLGDRTLTARIDNRSKHLVLSLGTGAGPHRREIRLVLQPDGTVSFEQAFGDVHRILQYDEHRKLGFKVGKPYKLLGRDPFVVETGLEVLLGDEGGKP